MDTDELRETLGETGMVGVAVLSFGFLLLERENRRAALGAAAIVVGHGLISHGLVGSVLESMGLSYDDL
jgi:hypothetical protein